LRRTDAVADLDLQRHEELMLEAAVVVREVGDVGLVRR